MRRVCLGVTALILVACERQGPAPSHATEAQREERIAAVRRELDREFVVFTAPSVAMDRAGAPVAAPVTVGSRPSPATMTSDDPQVVTVEPNGALAAHREGTTFVRAAGSASVLKVVVHAPRQVRAERPRPRTIGVGP